jgi:hypothetical protein
MEAKTQDVVTICIHEVILSGVSNIPGLRCWRCCRSKTSQRRPWRTQRDSWCHIHSHPRRSLHRWCCQRSGGRQSHPAQVAHKANEKIHHISKIHSVHLITSCDKHRSELLTLQDPWEPLYTQIMRALLKLLPHRLVHSESEMMGIGSTPWRLVGRPQLPVNSQS